MANLRITKTWRIEIDTIEKLELLKERTGTSINSLVNGALSAFVEKNEDLFPVKEDPQTQKKEEQTDIETFDMSKLRIDLEEDGEARI